MLHPVFAVRLPRRRRSKTLPCSFIHSRSYVSLSQTTATTHPSRVPSATLSCTTRTVRYPSSCLFVFLSDPCFELRCCDLIGPSAQMLGPPGRGPLVLIAFKPFSCNLPAVLWPALFAQRRVPSAPNHCSPASVVASRADLFAAQLYYKEYVPIGSRSSAYFS
jgi:hypothetical protein